MNKEELYRKYGLVTKRRKNHFFAQIQHESKWQPIIENFNYSKERLLKVFPKYFNEENVKKYINNPEKIANKVYANRMGNSNEDSGDGWKYRGRGYLQITGKNNYKQMSKDLSIDFTENPDYLLRAEYALLSALWFWNKNKLNKLADDDDIRGITKKINGGYNGLEDRIRIYNKIKNAT